MLLNVYTGTRFKKKNEKSEKKVVGHPMGDPLQGRLVYTYTHPKIYPNFFFYSSPPPSPPFSFWNCQLLSKYNRPLFFDGLCISFIQMYNYLGPRIFEGNPLWEFGIQPFSFFSWRRGVYRSYPLLTLSHTEITWETRRNHQFIFTCCAAAGTRGPETETNTNHLTNYLDEPNSIAFKQQRI